MDDHRNESTLHSRKKRKPTGNLTDPVLDHTYKEDLATTKVTVEKPKPKKEVVIRPSLDTRLDLSIPEPYPVGVKYTPPHPKHFKHLVEAKRQEMEKKRNFCKYTITRMPTKARKTKLGLSLKASSAQIEEAKVFPRKASVTPSMTYPEPPDRKELQDHEPKSGTIINVRKKRRVVKRKRPREPTIEELIASELATIQEMGEGEGEDSVPPMAPENYLTKQFRKRVAQLSKTTSYNATDFTMIETQAAAEGEGEEDMEEEEDLFISRLSQKFRRDSEMKRYVPPKRKLKKGTLENFSFTKLKQPTLKSFYYGIKMATVHQGDDHFPVTSRGRQGICMPIAAYCFSILKHPDRWTQMDLDDILEAGNELFLESAGQHHMHGDDVQLSVLDLQKYCKLGPKKVRFVVSEPEVSGMVKSEDKKIYNLTKAVNVFFGRYSAGILQTDNVNVALWKDKHYYFFDALPRTLDLFANPNGTALMAHFYDTTSIVSVLLNRSNLDNTPFVIYSIKAYKVLKRDAEEVDSKEVISEMDNYQVLSEDKAVALGSFDLADKCFGFSRNKQAMPISLVALVYSKITPPNSWHRGTVDKIIIIGNQLFLECIQNDETESVGVDDLPAVFTVGPYVIDVYIWKNRFVEFLRKKGKCVLGDRLEKFFETNCNALVEIGDCTLAVWKQRNVYHCFDPYSRNNEGLRCRDGAACVSMHTTVASLVDTVSSNFDTPDLIFRIHALKVCKIHRDPDRNDLFPRSQTMDDFPADCFKRQRMRRGHRRAVQKKVTADLDTQATCGEPPQESLLEVGSMVRSIGSEDLPPMLYKKRSQIRFTLAAAVPTVDTVADLDSPSLSDTQIEPPQLEDLGDVIEFEDLDAFDLTQEEMEMAERGEGGEGKGKGEDDGEDDGDDDEKQKVEKEMEEIANQGEGGEDEWYMAATDFTQVGSHSLLSRLSVEVETEMPPIEIPEEEVPGMVRDIAAIAKQRQDLEDGEKYECELTVEEEVNMWEEYMKESNFVNLPDNSQVVLGTKNMALYGGDVEIMAPFICIMAVTVARKYAIDSWSKDIVDYVLRCGSELYRNSNTRFDQNYKLEIAKVSLGSTDFSVRVDYVFDTYVRSRILGMAIGRMLFPRSTAGLVVTPTYSCAIFCKNHLYYLYDGFANNEVGLSKGPGDDGVACLSRFTSIEHLVARILHNKTKREMEENVEYNRFVLSSCHVKLLPKEEVDLGATAPEDEVVEQPGEDGGEPPAVHVQTYKKQKEEKEKKPSKMGYHQVEGVYKIEGGTALAGNQEASDLLKEDYFACVCACLLLLNNPLKRWDERKVQSALDEGVHIYNHAEDLDVCSKKFIKNILIDDYVFDIMTHRVEFSTFKSRRTLRTGIETMLQRKKQHFIIQFPNRSYTLSVEPDTNTFHLFDPGDPSGKASWTRYRNFAKLVHRLKSGVLKGCESYNFHTMDIMSIGNAPRHVVLGNRAKRYRVLKERKPETVSKPFHEECCWLDVDPIPWSWRTDKTRLSKWNNWYVDFADDLFSLFGTVSPLDDVFPVETKGKQSLANLVVAIGMTQIYELCDWNEAILDSVLLSGNVFFQECIKDITDENYEVAFEDIDKECTIFPYAFRVKFTPVVEGTMFLVRLKQFNLYKSLRLFFDEYERRYGIVCVTKSDQDKRLYAFGKLQESEYFLYDCETLGPPMYVVKDVGVPYMLRTTTLNRLLHVMTLTLRGGDFYIFDVGLSELKTIK